MGRRLKQIKKQDLGDFGKTVVDSLIKPIKPIKEEKLEQMRCKVDILEGYPKTNIQSHLIDSFVVNINSLEKLKDSIEEKYGVNVQYKITNLFDEEVVSKRSVYTGGYDKEKQDKESFSHQMEIIRKIYKLKSEGKTCEETEDKIAFLMARSIIRKIYSSTEEEQIQILKNAYENQNLGKLQIKI